MQGPEALPPATAVVVIGASLAGLVIALELAREGIEVCVLEAADTLGTGIEAQGLGHVELGVIEHPHRTIASLGAERAAALFRWSDRGKRWLLDEGLVDRCGVLWAALDDREVADIEASASALHIAGRRAEVWSAAEVDTQTGGEGFSGALWLPDDGRLVPGAMPTLVERAAAAGVLIVAGADARLVDDPSADGVVVEVAEHQLACDTLIIAAGARSGALTPSLGGRIVPVREQVLRTGPVALRPRPLGRAGQGWTTWSQQADGSLRVSGSRWASPHLEVGESDDTVLHPAIQERLATFTRERLAVPEAVAIESRWATCFAQTPDGLPLVGPLPGDPRLIVCAGFGSSPAALAAASAAAVVDGLLRDPEEGLSMLSTRRMVRWRADG